MTKAWIIGKRELAGYFDSLIAYVIIILFLIFTGIFTWWVGTNVFIRGQADLRVFFDIAYWTLFFFTPAITMRLIAEEYRSGTLELLSTKSIRDFDIIGGKFIASFLVMAIALACTLPYYFTVSSLGNVDHAAVWGGYLSLLLTAAAYISIGLFASSVTDNQIVAFLLALFISVFFHFLFDVIGSSFTGTVGSIFNYLSLRTHFDSISRGVLDSRDLIFFLSLIALGLIMATAMLTRRNWQD